MRRFMTRWAVLILIPPSLWFLFVLFTDPYPGAYTFGLVCLSIAVMLWMMLFLTVLARKYCLKSEFFDKRK